MTTSGDVPWPSAGVLRVHFEPAALPNLGDEPGANRFDDPRPRTVDRFLMRYAATTLRGCMLELLASLRGNAAAEERVTAVDVDDPNLVEAPAVPQWQHIADYLDGRLVATITARDLSMVSIDDPALQHELNQEPAVRAVLDTPAARQALLPQKHSRVALDNAAVRLASEIGRYITQACALALFDRPSKPDAIHFAQPSRRRGGLLGHLRPRRSAYRRRQATLPRGARPRRGAQRGGEALGPACAPRMAAVTLDGALKEQVSLS